MAGGSWNNAYLPTNASSKATHEASSPFFGNRHYALTSPGTGPRAYDHLDPLETRTDASATATRPGAPARVRPQGSPHREDLGKARGDGRRTGRLARGAVHIFLMMPMESAFAPPIPVAVPISLRVMIVSGVTVTSNSPSRLVRKGRSRSSYS